jgi:hypothetical protein
MLSGLALLVALVGCETRTTTSPAPDRGSKVDVKVGGGEGVKVDVEGNRPGDKTDVDVDVGRGGVKVDVDP